MTPSARRPPADGGPGRHARLDGLPVDVGEDRVDVLRPLGRLVVARRGAAAPGSLQRALISRSSWTERTPAAERAATAADTRSCSARTVPVSRATPFFTSTLILASLRPQRASSAILPPRSLSSSPALPSGC